MRVGCRSELESERKNVARLNSMTSQSQTAVNNYVKQLSVCSVLPYGRGVCLYIMLVITRDSREWCHAVVVFCDVFKTGNR